MSATEGGSQNRKFRPRARIMRTLGDELISSETMALIELVKNPRDADATRILIRFRDPLEPGEGDIGGEIGGDPGAIFGGIGGGIAGCAAGPAVVDAWTASAGSRHDFQWPEWSVEVKAAARRAGGAVLHRVHHLDQLADPEEGQLFLFSLRLVRDELAHNTLPDLAARIADSLRGDPHATDEFPRKLGRRGYSPAQSQRYKTPYRVQGERMYSVGPGFPRLIVASFADGLPSGVTDVSDVIDMAICDPWLVATNPDDWVMR